MIFGRRWWRIQSTAFKGRRERDLSPWLPHHPCQHQSSSSQNILIYILIHHWLSHQHGYLITIHVSIIHLVLKNSLDIHHWSPQHPWQHQPFGPQNICIHHWLSHHYGYLTIYVSIIHPVLINIFDIYHWLSKCPDGYLYHTSQPSCPMDSVHPSLTLTFRVSIINKFNNWS